MKIKVSVRKDRKKPLYFVALASAALLFACNQPEEVQPLVVPVGLENGKPKIRGNFDAGARLIKLAVEIPADPSAEWTGYELYITSNTDAERVDTTHRRGGKVDQGFNRGEINILSIAPGTAIGERLAAIALFYKKDGRERKTDVSNVIRLSVTPRSSLGCQVDLVASRSKVNVCLDSAGVFAIRENGKVLPALRVRTVPRELANASLDSIRAALPQLGAPQKVESAVIRGARWYLDSLSFSLESLSQPAQGRPLLTVLFEYLVPNLLNPGGEPEVAYEVAQIGYNNEAPRVNITSDRSGGNTKTVFVTNGDPNANLKVKRNARKTMFLNNVVRYFVPPNSPGVKDEYRVRVLYPIQAPSELGNLYSDEQVAWRKATNSYFPYVYDGLAVVPNFAFANRIEPGGFMPMQWVEKNKKAGLDSIVLEQYVKDFNALPADQRVWKSFDIVTDSSKPSDFKPSAAVLHQGTFQFDFESYAQAKSELFAYPFARKIDETYPVRLPVFNSEKGVRALKAFEKVESGGDRIFPFFRMPTYWQGVRRNRSFVLEFEFKGVDFDEPRKVFSINQEDLAIPTGAPPVLVNGIFDDLTSADRYRRGAMFLEGLLEGELPVSRSLLYNIVIGSGENHFSSHFEGFAFYSLIPKNEEERYVNPVIEAFKQADLTKEYWKVDQAAYRIIKELVAANKTDINQVSLTPTGALYVPENISETRAMNAFFNTTTWADGVYILWFGTADRDFVSGPLVQGKPGPALVTEIYNPHQSKADRTSYRGIAAGAANIRIFRFKR